MMPNYEEVEKDFKDNLKEYKDFFEI